MRTLCTALLGLTLAAGCGGTPPAGPNIKEGGPAGSATLQGSVFGVTFAPDSTSVPMVGATVELFVRAFIPPDTMIGPPPSPGDTMLTLRQTVARVLPGATPADTVVQPPDTEPPPPPPPPPCASQGSVAATATTDATGAYHFVDLVQAYYDVKVTPPPGSGFQETVACGIPVVEGEAHSYDFYLPAVPPPPSQP